MLTTNWQLRSESGKTTAAVSQDRLSLNCPRAFIGLLLHACPKLGAVRMNEGGCRGRPALPAAPRVELHVPAMAVPSLWGVAGHGGGWGVERRKQLDCIKGEAGPWGVWFVSISLAPEGVLWASARAP